MATTTRQESEEGIELTEKLVLTRTRATDLESVKKINCWASNITDVSVVRKMPNLEVCSLSINRINTLRDFAHCHRLKELYVRTNKISCLGDIHYLKQLPKLRSLWLAENPCADTEGYRNIVLRSLPNLQKLDNTVVKPQEILEALNSCEEIAPPDDFSTSSVFHDSISNSSSVSTLSSVDSVSCSTSNSVSDSLPVARKKREKRRLKKAEEEELARKSTEGDVAKSGDSVNDSIEIKEGQNDNSSRIEVMDGNDKSSLMKDTEKNKSGLSNSISDDSSRSRSYSGDSSEGTFSNEIISSKDEDIQNDKNDDNDRPNDAVTESKSENDVCHIDFTADGDDNEIKNKNKRSVDIGNDDDGSNEKGKENILNCNNSNVIEANSDRQLCSKLSGGDSMLDKIRLDDSLRLEEEVNQDCSDSIDVDDLDIVIIDNDDNNEIKGKTNDRENVNGSLNDTLTGGEMNSISSDLVVVDSKLSSSLEEKSGSIDEEGSKKGAMSKVESVDWDEYNRMRQDLGIKPVEKLTTWRPKSSDVARARNSNILQAVLSLVKELDKDSLDLVASAVKLRMDSL